MRCCAPGCNNDSKHVSKSKGITFHIFPTEPTLRSAWLCAINKQGWEPKNRSAICSEHFLPEDFYETKNGFRKVRSGAVPYVVKDSTNCDLKQATTDMVCRICLATDRKMFPIQSNGLELAYEGLTGYKITNEDKLPHHLCFECIYRLKNYVKFRRKSLQAHKLLTDLVEKDITITKETIETSWNSNPLPSHLQQKFFQPDHYDLQIEHTDSNDEITQIKTDIQPNFDSVQVNNEEENLFINENIYQEDFIPDNISEEIKTENDLIDTGFTSDDSLPLETSRKRRKNRKSTEKVPKRLVKNIKKDPNEKKVDRRRKPFLNDDLNETLFTITDLSIDEQIAEVLKRQESSNYRNAVFKCTECFKGFLDEDAYNCHMSRHTKKCGDFQCDICKNYYKTRHALRKHITAHHTQRFNCNLCPYVTTHRQTARLHERWHKGTKYQCPHCQDEFVKFTTYMGHIRIKHPSDFVCQLCGYSFVSEKGISLHKKLKHRLDNYEIPEDGPYCDLCNVRFVSLQAHRQHLRVSARHMPNDKESTDHKPKGRKTRETKEREKKLRGDSEDDKRLYPSQIRKAEGPIPCEQCGLQLADSRAYHGHFRRMHPDKNRTNYPSMKSPCMCEMCGRMFQSYALLKDHRWTHTGERSFECETCGKTFRMKQRLVAHRRIHSAMKTSYACNLCGKHFSTHSNRQRHMFVHTGLKPFKCEMCGKCFKHVSEKRAHITYVHLKKPWPKRTRAKRRSENRQGLPLQSAVQPGTELEANSEIDISNTVWPACDPKLDHINAIMNDKPMYYNLKI